MSRKCFAIFATFITVVLFLGTRAAAQVSVTAANPSSAAPGTVNLNVTISGSGFKKGAKAQFFITGTTNPGDVVVNSTAFSSTNQVVANINVSSTATNANYDIAVMNTNGSSGKGTELFGVNGTANGSCTSQNPAVNVVLAPGSNGLHLIYGDSDFGSGANTYYNANDQEFNGGSIYSGVFNVCSSSLDLTVNLNTTSRFVNASFFQQVAPSAPSAVSVFNHTYPITFFNLRNAYVLQAVGGTYNTCLFNSVQYTNSESFALRFESATTDATVCPSSAIYNTGGDTSVVQITHPDSCTWLVHPLLDSSGQYYRAGLAETIKKQTLSGGQYNLPFAMKVTLATCP